VIKIDKEGNWFYNGMEMFRKDIIKLFYDHLKRDEAGIYFIELDNDSSVIEVEDVPYVVKAVYNKDLYIEILLNDQTIEKLDPSTLRVGAENVLYCSVKNDEFEARFSRAAYYQIAELVEYGDDKKSFYVPINNCNYYINNSYS
jgi:hypothetical protein